jgi:DNA modification methylase
MLTVEQWPVSRLIPYVRNPRKNDHEALAKMRAAIREFGFRVPVVARSDGLVVDGHLRLAAAVDLGLTEIPVALADELSETQIKAFRLLANRSASWAEWDDELLSLELSDLKEAGFDLNLTGFDGTELRELMMPVEFGLANEDALPAEPETRTKPGDLWQLGGHRLLCGDATNGQDVSRLLGGSRPNLMVTDPPYGVNYNPGWRKAAGVSASDRIGKVENDDRADWREAWTLFPGDVTYVWHAALHSATVTESLKAAGFDIRSQIIWSKPRFALGRGDYHWQHEPCWYAVRRGGKGNWQGGRDQSTVWTVGNAGSQDAATVHGTQKPVEVMRRPILNNSLWGEVVYEPFAGSGTTIIAAHSVGRSCYALELSPKYCDVILERYETLTGEQAKRMEQ